MYYSADSAIATVDAAGNVKRISDGIVNIYSVATSGDYKVTTILITK